MDCSTVAFNCLCGASSFNCALIDMWYMLSTARQAGGPAYVPCTDTFTLLHSLSLCTTINCRLICALALSAAVRPDQDTSPRGTYLNGAEVTRKSHGYAVTSTQSATVATRQFSATSAFHCASGTRLWLAIW
ncbi:hypothetical protein FA95DRAFT_1122810 [Auriscalpium vulgare]|uniref:Uncharacterized protein n=1 Tax=Auriscalpium vulgare TaxID=40419 RepID=A0ACB8R5U1_9AGAM|nr:hypothetical protein FA95DRAFT_1122810 [Auriscalpium vulgare]